MANSVPMVKRPQRQRRQELHKPIIMKETNLDDGFESIDLDFLHASTGGDVREGCWGSAEAAVASMKVANGQFQVS